jgi:uridine kinase
MRQLIAIDGPGGAGKSTLARHLERALGAAATVHMDHFFLPTRERPSARGRHKPIGGDIDWRRLRAEVLDPLHVGGRVRYRRYDWTADALAEWHDLDAGGAVIIEGVYSMRADIRDRYNLCIWVTAAPDLMLERVLAKDGKGGRSIWMHDWIPAYENYVAQQQPQRNASIVVDGAALEPSAAAARIAASVRLAHEIGTP